MRRASLPFIQASEAGRAAGTVAGAILLALLWALVLSLAAPADARGNPKCSLAQANSADRMLWLNSRDKKLSVEQNLPWGAPRPPAGAPLDRLLIHWDYVIGYDDDLRVPMWTGERIVGSGLGKAVRSDCFRADPRLPASVASTPGDYSEPTFDQGHVTPSADLTKSKISVWNSFIMSNMTPQYAHFNRGIWRMLEDMVRRWAIGAGTGYVISGSVFDRDQDGLRDSDSSAELMKPSHGVARVAIPTAFFKLLAIPEPDGSVRTIAFMLPNDTADIKSKDAPAYLKSKIAHLDAIQHVTGYTLLPAATSIHESDDLWPLPKSAAHPKREGPAPSRAPSPAPSR